MNSMRKARHHSSRIESEKSYQANSGITYLFLRLKCIYSVCAAGCSRPFRLKNDRKWFLRNGAPVSPGFHRKNGTDLPLPGEMMKISPPGS